MRIRDAELKDAKQLDKLLSKLIQYESQYDSNLVHDCIIEDNYCNRIGLDGHKLILVEENEEIMGYLYGFIYHVPGVYKSPIAIVDSLFVDENHRRKGYATLLMKVFRNFAIEKGACQIELKVVSENRPAVDLYNKLTFMETKKYMKIKL